MDGISRPAAQKMLVSQKNWSENNWGEIHQETRWGFISIWQNMLLNISSWSPTHNGWAHVGTTWHNTPKLPATEFGHHHFWLRGPCHGDQNLTHSCGHCLLILDNKASCMRFVGRKNLAPFHLLPYSIGQILVLSSYWLVHRDPSNGLSIPSSIESLYRKKQSLYSWNNAKWAHPTAHWST